MSYTISITSVGAGISSIHWMRYGNNSMGVEVMLEDGYLYQGGSLSKTANSGYLKLDVTTQRGYTNPTYYRSTPSYYEQNLNDDKIISFNANKSGYIKAQASTTYTISYDANGGSGAPAAQTGITPTASVTLRTDTPSRTFYNFLGWSTSSTATSATYQPGQTITVYSNMTLYAVWKYDGATLTYDANGGTGAPNAIIQRRGTTFTVSSTVPTRAGYTFNGWFRGTNQQTYYGGDTLILNSDETISAKWQAVTYSVNFRDNDGTFIMSRTTTGSFTFPSYSKTGYTFKGWSLSSTPTYVTYYASNTYTVSSNIIVYAVYTVDLSFSADGASNVPSSKYGYVGSGSSYTCTIPDDVPTKSGYTFLYWVRYNDDDSYNTFSPGTSITLYKSTTLYAQFTVTTYSVAVSLGAHVAQANLTYTNSAGTSVTTTISTATTITVKAGGGITVNTALTTDPRCYASDMVYYTAGISTVGVSIGTAYQISQSQSLEVRSKVIQYTLHYDLNGGSAGSNDFSDKPVAVETSGDNIGKAIFTLPEYVPTAPSSEFVFSAWAVGTTIYLPGDTLRASGNTTVTASYVLKTYEVHFEVKSGIGYVTIEWTNALGETVTRAFSPSDYTTTNIAAKSGTNVAVTATLANNRWENATISYFSGSAKTEAQRITTVSSGGAKIVTSEMWADIEAERVTVSAFTYHGSDGTDNYYFRTNLSVTSAVTAESMERMGTVCQSIAILNEMSWGGWPTITQGAIIHASEFNAILNRLSAMQAQLQQYGYSPAYLPDNVIGLSTMTEGQIPTVITPELFIGERSLKNCVNAMVQFTNQRT